MLRSGMKQDPCVTCRLSCFGATDSAGSFLEEPAASACGLLPVALPCDSCLPAKDCKQQVKVVRVTREDQAGTIT